MAARKPLVLGSDGFPQQLQAADSLAGVGGAAWTLAQSWTFSGTAVHSVDFVGLDGANDILIVAKDITTSISAQIAVLASVNNGSSFYNTTGDYISISNGQLQTTQNALMGDTSSGTLSLKGFWGLLMGASISGSPKLALSSIITSYRMLVASLLPINALRVFAFDNGGTATFTAGSIYLFTR